MLEVELLALRAEGLGLDGDHPRLRAARRRVPRAVAADLRRSTPRTGAVAFRRRRSRCRYRPFPGTLGVAPRRAGRALDRAAVALRRQHGHQAPAHRGRRSSSRSASRARCSRSATRTRRRATARSAARRSRRPMDVIRPALRCARDVTIDAPQYAPARRARTAHGAQASYHVCTGVGPDLMEALARRRPRDDRPSRRPPRARAAGGLRAGERGRRPAHPRGRRRAQLGRRRIHPGSHIRRR